MQARSDEEKMRQMCGKERWRRTGAHARQTGRASHELCRRLISCATMAACMKVLIGDAFTDFLVGTTCLIAAVHLTCLPSSKRTELKAYHHYFCAQIAVDVFGVALHINRYA